MTLDHRNNLDPWVETLYQNGFGNSGAQETLISVLSVAQCPMSAEEIREAVQCIRPETGRATVYRFIDKLTGLGLLRRVHGYRNCSTYFPSLGVHQMLLICTECGKVSYLKPDLFVQVINTIENIIARLEDHHITTCHLQLSGTCKTCKTDPL